MHFPTDCQYSKTLVVFPIVWDTTSMDVNRYYKDKTVPWSNLFEKFWVKSRIFNLGYFKVI